LTLGSGVYEKNVQLLRKLYASLHNTGKTYEKKCQDLRTKQEAIDCGLECIEELQQIVQKNSSTLRQIADMTKVSHTIRRTLKQ
jgi:hypothetical protein